MAAAKGNSYSSKTERLWANTINRKVKQNPDQLERIALKVLAAAENGEPWAVTEIRNTLDGKPVQQVEMNANVNNQTVRDLPDSELLRIAAQGQDKHPDTDGQTIQ